MSFHIKPEHSHCGSNVDLDEMNVRAFTVLKAMFGGSTEEVIIRDVLSNCNGNLTASMEYLMNITNSTELNLNGEKLILNPNHEDTNTDNKETKLSVSSKNEQSERERIPKSLSSPQKLTSKTNYQNAIDDTNCGYRVCVLLRGLPGSGKTTLAKQFVQATVKGDPANHVFSTDDFFWIRNSYNYSAAKVPEAHSWNQKRVKNVLCQGLSPVIIDNTNLELWEMKFYAQNAVENGYIIHILEPQTRWAQTVSILASKNSHNVPIEKIRYLKSKYQPIHSKDDFIKYFDLKYPPSMVLPKTRAFPPISLAPVTLTSSILQPTILHSVHNTQKPLELIDTSNSPYFGSPPMKEFPKKPNNGVGSEFINWSNNSDSSLTIRDWKEPTNTNASFSTGINFENRMNIGEVSPSPGLDFNSSSPKILPEPKPQRTPARRRQDKSALFPSESINWEPISTCMSDWEHVEKPISNAVDLMTDLSKKTFTAEYVNASTNTMSHDTQPVNFWNFKILKPISRDINSSYVSPKQPTPRLKICLDKGTMTHDVGDICQNGEDLKNNSESLECMRNMFHDIPQVYLQHVLDKCKGDVNWAVEILLDGKTGDALVLSEQPELVSEEAKENAAEAAEGASLPQESPSIHDSLQHETEDVEVPEKEDNSFVLKSIELKKHLEENFVISDTHYSEHVQKLRKKIHGDKNPQLSTGNDHIENVPITESVPEPGPSGRSASESSGESEEDTIVSVTVGKEFIENMQNLFGTFATADYSLEPIIHMPFSMVSQIHALWMESVCNQIYVQKEYRKAILKEDEDFARMLQDKENEERMMGEPHAVPNLREIMDMEVALARYKANVAQWKNETPQDMASRLSRQKLIQLFPNIDQEILLEVLNAYDNSFEQTCQVLLVSTGKILSTQSEDESQTAIMNMLKEQEADLLTRANQEQEMVMTSEELTTPSNKADGKELIQSCRDEANQHLECRNLYLGKAKEYYGRGMTQVAAYYSRMAALHTRKHDFANSLAASEIMEASTSQDDYTLDLHHLYVVEARQVLDLFLDKHIQQLREKAKVTDIKLFLITGRGLHSPQNHPRIKPAVIARLKFRGMRYHEVNPGLLGVYINALHMLSDTNSERNN